MKFIRDYRQFIEVGCTSCNRKHTVQTDNYTISSQGYTFHSPIKCSCGHMASIAEKDKRTWTIKTEKNELMKRNKATTIKLMLVIGFTIVFFAGEMFFVLNKQEAEQKSAQHEAEKETSSLFANHENFEY
ncbi:hypothetical protein [Bacillus sp. FJAT-28004]|uniref:hypothetical protein n=1 Tax=Bacillus sp. FJAT-28004 TaxID=1679165 RepID=UPI0006B441DB|nr:hypothetical protein [Bacillus sp. FJAT-28004]